MVNPLAKKPMWCTLFRAHGPAGGPGPAAGAVQPGGRSARVASAAARASLNAGFLSFFFENGPLWVVHNAELFLFPP